MSEPRTLDEWRRASELADAELGSFDRRTSRSLFASWVTGAARAALVSAAEDARLGLLRATHAAEAGAEAGAGAPDPPPRSGPEVIATRAEVEAIRDRLIAEGKSHGYGSVAKAGGWSVATVRRRLEGN